MFRYFAFVIITYYSLIITSLLMIDSPPGFLSSLFLYYVSLSHCSWFMVSVRSRYDVVVFFLSDGPFAWKMFFCFCFLLFPYLLDPDVVQDLVKLQTLLSIISHRQEK